MTLTVNGELREVRADTVSALLIEVLGGLPETGLAVAVNDEVVPRRLWGERALKLADRVEVIRAVGGG